MKIIPPSRNRIILIFSLIFCIIILYFVFIDKDIDKNPKTEAGILAQKNSSEELEANYLRNVLKEDLIVYSNIEAPSIMNIGTGTDESGNYLSLKLIPNQPLKNNGIRAEVSIDYPYREGDTVSYQWDFKIPKDFTSDFPKNRWWIFADWHDQPDITKGETWDTYIGKSSPIIIGYGNIVGNDVLSLSTGIHGSEIGILPRGSLTFTRGVWHTLKVVIRWSQKEDGEVLVFFDDSVEPVLSATGPNMINGYQHYLKVGQYRNPEIMTENTISLKNISIKK